MTTTKSTYVLIWHKVFSSTFSNKFFENNLDILHLQDSWVWAQTFNHLTDKLFTIYKRKITLTSSMESMIFDSCTSVRAFKVRALRETIKKTQNSLCNNILIYTNSEHPKHTTCKASYIWLIQDWYKVVPECLTFSGSPWVALFSSWICWSWCFDMFVSQYTITSP